jgi:hypothetical protein
MDRIRQANGAVIPINRPNSGDLNARCYRIVSRLRSIISQTNMVQHRRITWLGLCCLAWLIIGSCGKSGGNSDATTRVVSPVPAEPPLNTGGTTDPACDWENPASLDERRPPAQACQSTKTLDQTTRWLRWALERYGHTHPTIYSNDLSEVRFNGCNMEWTERQKPDDERDVTRVSHRSLILRDISLGRGSVQVFSSEVRISTGERGITVSNRYFEKGTEKPRGAPENEMSARFPLREEDKMPARIGFALVHAARLCGAQAPVER